MPDQQQRPDDDRDRDDDCDRQRDGAEPDPSTRPGRIAPGSNAEAREHVP